MANDDFELVRGSGNVFRDLDLPNPGLEQFRAPLAAQIIKVLDAQKLSVRAAQDLTGIAANFTRIRRANIGRFTVDRLMTISVSDYLIGLRIGEACARLAATAQPIQPIAAEVGYASLANFNRQFLRLRGMTPREYRASLRR